MSYKDRVAAGLCGKCGVSVKEGSLCPKHREEARVKAAEKRAKRKQANACIGCGKKGRKLSAGGRCQKCLDYNAGKRRDEIAANKVAGECQSCGGKHGPVKAGCSMCQKCIDDRSEISSRHYFRRKVEGTCCYCAKPPEAGKTLCKRHQRLYKNYRFQTKMAALEAYGGPICVECGNEDADILEIDHIKGGGRKHFREEGITGGYSFYLWLKQHGYPTGYRVLCPTCNKKAYKQQLLSSKS